MNKRQYLTEKFRIGITESGYSAINLGQIEVVSSFKIGAFKMF